MAELIVGDNNSSRYMDSKEVMGELGPILIEGEEVVLVRGTKTKYNAITDRRIIGVEARKATVKTKRKVFMSLPFSQAAVFSIERAGSQSRVEVVFGSGIEYNFTTDEKTALDIAGFIGEHTL